MAGVLSSALGADALQGGEPPKLCGRWDVVQMERTYDILILSFGAVTS